MSYYDFFDSDHNSSTWIYIGGDIYNRTWSKVGKTANGLNTRHTSSQNPGYFIYTAFNIVRGDVHEIESELLEYLVRACGLIRITHFSTGSLSECFWVNPNQMTCLVEGFIRKKYGSCVTYENSLHGEMSRYQCRDDIVLFFDDDANQSLLDVPDANRLNRTSYFTGNQEVYEIDLGGGHYLDVATGLIKHESDDF